MKIAVIGTGYVGLVAGVCFADAGHEVACVDTDPAKVDALRAGRVPIYEPGLEALLHRVVREGRISFTSRHEDAVRGARVVFVAVGTPDGGDGAPDLSHVDRAAADVLQAVDGPVLLVLKSTVPVGTAARLRTLAAKLTRRKVHVVSNPEFLKEGDALNDFLRPDRVVIGTDSDEAWETMRTLYEPFVLSGKPILRMSNVDAEITKYASNAMLATRVSFVNEIARLCEAVGADVKAVTRGMGADRRIGPSFLYAGCGYGGSCFPKDTQGLIHVATKAGVPMEIVAAAERVNAAQKRLLVEKVKARFGEDLRGRRLAIWGLTFKPQTDDVREAPALQVAADLLAAGATVVGTDPEGIVNFGKAMGGTGIELEADPYHAATGADAVILCTEWNEYRGVDLERLKGVMKQPVFFDGRNVVDPERLAAAGFEHAGIGRPGNMPRAAKERVSRRARAGP
jgi:UDPglucose 6-dehydrogenase